MSRVFTLKVIPNLITLLRLLLVVPVAISILRGEFILTLILFAICSISDGLDGYLARRFDCASRFGAMLDPIADKLLLVVTFILVTYIGVLPFWLAAVVIARDLIILTGATVYRILFGEYEFSPTIAGKFSTAFQFILVLMVLVDLSVIDIYQLLMDGAIILVFIVSSVSGIDYVVTWSRKAIAASRQQ